MTTEPMKIVLVDDDEDDRMFFSDALREIDIHTELKQFENGKEFLSYLEQEETEGPHLIFLDLNMPVMNGFECLKALRNHPDFKDLVVAIYSTSSSEKDIEETFLKGANIYINKPNSFDALKKTLAQVVKRHARYRKNALDQANFLFRI